MLKWTSLRNGLWHFKELGSEFFLWGIPVIAILIGVFNQLFSRSAQLHPFLLTLFIVALPMAGAQLIYSLRCPSALKGIGSESEWRNQTIQRTTEILTALRRSDEIKEYLSKRLQDTFAKKIAEHTLETRFTPAQEMVILREVGSSAIDAYTSDHRDLQALAQTTTAQFDRLNTQNKSSLVACAVLLGFAIFSGSIEILLRVIEVVSASEYGSILGRFVAWILSYI